MPAPIALPGIEIGAHVPPGFVAAWAARSPHDRLPVTRLLQGAAEVAGRIPPANEIWLVLGTPTLHSVARTGDCACGPLSPAETERMQRFRQPEDRWGFAAARGLLRRYLGAMLECAPEAIQLEADPATGKLLLKGHAHVEAPELHFNVSHTRGLVAVAFAACPVGVDVERIRPIPEMAALVEELMSPAALARFSKIDDRQRQAGLFFRYWTLSEAFLKASGEGLAGTTRNLDFTPDGVPKLLGHAADCAPDHWHFGCSTAHLANWQRARPNLIAPKAAAA